MHIISDKSLERPDYIYNRHGIGYHRDSRPEINWKHIDGPLLYYRDGQLHWLTLWERFCCWLGLDDAESIELKRRPDLDGAYPCTCHPDDNPPRPCPRRYAYSECVKTAASGTQER